MSDPHHPKEPDAPGHGQASKGPHRLAANFTDGGHEVDYTPNRNLFGFLMVMLAVMIISAIGVYQLFVVHTESQLEDAATLPSSQLSELKARDEHLATTYGAVTFEDKPAGYRVPIAEARKMMLADPSRFAAAAPPAGWVHPDDAAKQPPQPPQPPK